MCAAAAAPALGQSVSVTGNAPFPLTTVYGSNQETLTLTVNANIILEQMQVPPGFNDFSIAQNNCYIAYQPAGATCTFTVNFSPRLPGWASSPAPIARTAPLQIQYYDYATNAPITLTLPLAGTGQSPQGVLSPGPITDLIGNDITRPTGFGGDGDAAANAVFTTPAGIAMDVAGNIYIADTGNGVIRLYYQAGTFPWIPGALTPGNVYTVAGVAPVGGVSNAGPGVDDVIATSSPLSGPTGIAVDGLGNLYIADSNNQAVRMVAAGTGIITTVAGTLNSPEAPGTGFSGDLGPATQAQLYIPASVSVDGYGNIYIADSGNNAIRVVYEGGAALAALIALEIPGTIATPGDIYTLAGGPANAAQPSNGDGALASAANLNSPQGVTVDSLGDIYIADSTNTAVRRVDAVSGNISSVYTAGDTPVSMAVDSSDSVYFTLKNACSVMQYNPTLQTNLTTPATSLVAGNGACMPTGDNGPSNMAGFAGAQGVVADGAGNLYILEADGVRMVASSNTSLNFGNVNVGSTSPAATVLMTDDDILPYNNILYYSTQSAYFQFGQNYTTFNYTPYIGTNPNITDCDANYFGGYLSGLNPGHSCGASFIFQPVNDGGPLSNYVFNNAGGSVSFSGTGTGPLPTVTLTGGPLMFSAVASEGSSAAQTLVLTNTSAITLTLASIYFGTTNFSETDNCGISNYTVHPTLAAGASCNINVTFGANTTAVVNDTIYVIDNASSGGGTQTASLSGTGLAPLGVLASPTFATTAPGGTANGMVTLTNNGTAILHIDLGQFTLTGNDPGKFAVTGTTCGATLPIAASCTISVSFTPTTYAYYSADLNVPDDSGGVRIFTTTTPPTYVWNVQLAHLVGTTGIESQSSSFTLSNATFPATTVNSSLTQTVNLTLHQATVLKSIGIAPGFNDYTIAGPITGCVLDGVTVNATASVCAIPITFTPSAPGIRNAPLFVVDIEGTSPVSYDFALTGTGSGPLAVLTPGIMTTVVGSAQGQADGIIGADGPAVNATVGFTRGEAIDTAGNIFLADEQNNVIWKTDTSGNIHLYAGTPFPYGGYIQDMRGDGGTALGANIAYVGALALDPKDGLYLADTDGYGDAPRIRYIDPATGLITTVVGTGSGCPGQTDSLGDGCTALQAMITNPTGIVVDTAGNLYFTDSGTSNSLGSLIRRVDAVTKIVTIVAGGNGYGYTGDGAQATKAAINAVGDLALDSLGNLYFPDDAGYILREVNLASGIISTAAGKVVYTGQYETCAGGSGDGGPVSAAVFALLTSVTIDAANNIYVMDQGACHVRRIDAATTTIHNVAGTSAGTYNYYNVGFGDIGQGPYISDGDATQAYLNEPFLIRLDSNANVYLASAFGGVRKVDVSQSVLNFTGWSFTTNGTPQQLGTVSAPQTATVLNAGNAGTVDFAIPFEQAPLWGIGTTNFLRDVSSPTGATDCYALTTLAPGNECPVSVDFAPLQGPGYLTDVDTVSDNAAPNLGTQPIKLIGDVSGTTLLVTLTPSLLSFSTPQGTPSMAQTLTLTNNDVNPLPISSISIPVSPTIVYSQTNNCGTSLAANSSCAIQVTFSPPVVAPSPGFVPPDVFSGQVIVTDSAANSPQASALTGIGTVPTGTVSDGFVKVDETAHFTDTVIIVPSTLINVQESVTFTDTVPIAPSTLITVPEAVTFTDALSGLPAAGTVYINDPETIHTTDTPTSTKDIFISDPETIHTTDSSSFPVVAFVNDPETIHTTDSTQLPVFIRDLETIHTTDAPLTTAGAKAKIGIVLSAIPTTVLPGQNTDIKVTVTGVPDNNGGTLYVYNGVTQIAAIAVQNGVTDINLNLPTAGIYTLVARYAGNAEYTAVTSNTLTLTATQATIAIAVSDNPSTVTASQNTVVKVVVSGVPDNNGGTLYLYDNGTTQIAAIAVQNGTTNVNINFPSTGPYTFTARYAGNTEYAPVTSNTVILTVGPAIQAITFPAIPNVPLAIQTLTMTAYSSSGLPIVYTVSGPATVSGSKVTLTGTGQVTVTANQAGNSAYQPASKSQIFTVTP